MYTDMWITVAHDVVLENAAAIGLYTKRFFLITAVFISRDFGALVSEEQGTRDKRVGSGG